MNNYLMLLEASTSASGAKLFSNVNFDGLAFCRYVFSDDSSSEKTAKKRAGDS